MERTLLSPKGQEPKDQYFSTPAAGSSSQVNSSTSNEVYEEEHLGRERLRRHREEVAGRVIIPETWGQENLLMEWRNFSSFDKLLAPDGIGSARRALVAESRIGPSIDASSAHRLSIYYDKLK